MKSSLYSQLLHGSGSSRGYWGWGCSCPERIWGKKVNLRYRVPPERRGTHWREGSRTGSSWRGCQGGAGWSWETAWGPVSELCTGSNTKELSGYLEFFTVRSKGFQGGADRQYSLPGTCRCFLFLNHTGVFSALYWSGHPSS